MGEEEKKKKIQKNEQEIKASGYDYTRNNQDATRVINRKDDIIMQFETEEEAIDYLRNI